MGAERSPVPPPAELGTVGRGTLEERDRRVAVMLRAAFKARAGSASPGFTAKQRSSPQGKVATAATTEARTAGSNSSAKHCFFSPLPFINLIVYSPSRAGRYPSTGGSPAEAAPGPPRTCCPQPRRRARP